MFVGINSSDPDLSAGYWIKLLVWAIGRGAFKECPSFVHSKVDSKVVTGSELASL